jgi:hypothetical protein
MSAALPHSRLCANQWMGLHQSAYLNEKFLVLGILGIFIMIERWSAWRVACIYRYPGDTPSIS